MAPARMEELPERPPMRPMPSSFDSDPDFFNENRWRKLGRKLREEPLVPLGCGLTCWALYNAYRAIRKGDSWQAQRMFRMRLYGQSFTLVAMVGGSLYYQADRNLRYQHWKVKKEIEEREKKERWIKELEARDAEDREYQEKREQAKKAMAAAAAAEAKEEKESRGLEAGSVMKAVKDLKGNKEKAK
ncbi:MAG: hypothetical protein LQ342_006396 [Letrouitia transgressa]|nr:MAG: hypothetical protein LQ342_006396 [Letrouitia transgressa]